MLSICITVEVYKRGPKNMKYPPLEVDLDGGKLQWLVSYPDHVDNFVFVKHRHVDYIKYYRLQCA